MRSDHWNFLANLLGAPGSDPPKEEQDGEEAKGDVNAESATDASAGAGESSTPLTEHSDSEVDAVAHAEAPVEFSEQESADQSDADDRSAVASSTDHRPPVQADAHQGGDDPAAADEPDPESILDALTSVKPPATLPGFGTQAEPKDEAQKHSDDLFRESASEDRKPSPRRDEAGRLRSRRDQNLDDAVSTESRPERSGRGDKSRRGGRGRRVGTRQQLSEEDLDRMERGEKPRETSERDEASGGRTRRSGRRDRGRDEDREETDDDFAAGLVDDHDESDDDRGIDAEADDDDGARESRRGRSRRRGRRGNRRRGRRDEVESRDDADDDESGETDRPIPSSAFDDDHEDDEEVEVMRRGRSRGRRDRGDRDRGEKGRRDDDGQRDSRSDDDRSDEKSGKRRNVPTWKETVDILVDANLENRSKRSGRGGGGGGRGGSGRSRRR